LVRETGLEPVQISPADFKSAAATDYATLAKLVLPTGFEPVSCPNLEPMPRYKLGVLPLNYRRKNFK